jgi:hypothetical protein
MYRDVTIKDKKVQSISADGFAEIVVYLDSNVDQNFARWFRDPTTHNYTPRFNTHNCTVQGDKIICHGVDIADDKAVSSAISLVKEWVASANEYARAIDAEEQTGKQRTQKLMTERDKLIKEVQNELDKL